MLMLAKTIQRFVQGITNSAPVKKVETNICPFHLAFPVSDLQKTRDFYEGVIGCEVGRTDEKWIDFNFSGHQISAHLNPEELREVKSSSVDSKAVPCRHFGLVMNWNEFDSLAERFQVNDVKFLIEPEVRFKGLVGEQKTMFVWDPSGNALEFKAFQDESQIFAA